MTDPTGFDVDLAALIAACEPKWVACARCGTETARAVCWECQRIADKGHDAKERFAAAEASVFAAYRVPFRESALRERKVPAPLVERARQVLDCPNVVLFGKRTKQGKSSLGGAMLLEWAARNDGVARWVSAYDLCGGELKLDPELVAADLLLIDDLGNERQMASTLVPELLEKRRGNGRALWVTTPLGWSALSARYGENNASRVYEGAKVLDFDKQDAAGDGAGRVKR